MGIKAKVRNTGKLKGKANAQQEIVATTMKIQAGELTLGDLAGYTVAGQLRKTYTSTTSTAFTSSVFSASGGIVKISLNATTTNALKAGRYVYDVEITKTSTGEITRIIEGQLEVRPGVTRAN